MTDLPRVGDGRSVLMVSPYFPPQGGGLELYARTIGKALADDFGWRVVFVASGQRGLPATVAEEDGLRVYRMPPQLTLSRTPFSLAWPKMLRQIAIDEDAVLVNAHTPVPGISDAVAVMLGDLPFVLTCHAGPIRKGRPLIDTAIRAYEGTVMRFSTHCADAVICNSEYVRGAYSRDVTGKSVVISPGVDVSTYRPAGPGKPGAVVFVAQLDVGMEFKGLGMLLRATKDLVAAGVDMTLEVVGSGSLLWKYQQTATDLGLGKDRVRFSGHLDGHELVEAYQRSSIAVLPSTNESFGMCLAEAMACGLAVVAARSGGIPALVDEGKTGLLVSVGSVEELAAAIRKLVDDPLLAASLGEAGRHRAETEFSWGSRVRATNDVFASVLDRRRDPRTVAVVAPRYPPDLGGVERYASLVAEGLRGSEGLKPLVISTRPGIRTSYEYRNDVPVIRLGSWIRAGNTPLSPLWPLQMRRLLRTRDVALLHVHSPVPGLADVATAVSGDRPVVLTYHAGSMLKGRKLVDVGIAAYEKHILPRILARTAQVVAVSPTTTVSGRPGVEIVYPAVDLEAFYFAEERPSSDPTVLFVGRLDSDAWKGERILFAALREVARSVPEVRLEIAGDGKGRHSWELAAAEHGISERVRFSGMLTGADLVEAYHRSSVVVLPSLNETESFGMCLIEAMACGRAVIGSRVGGIPYAVEDLSDGLLVPPGDAPALAAALLELCTNPTRRAAMGLRGRRKVEDRFSVSGFQSTYEKIFTGLLS